MKWVSDFAKAAEKAFVTSNVRVISRVRRGKPTTSKEPIPPIRSLSITPVGEFRLPFYFLALVPKLRALLSEVPVAGKNQLNSGDVEAKW